MRPFGFAQAPLPFFFFVEETGKAIAPPPCLMHPVPRGFALGRFEHAGPTSINPLAVHSHVPRAMAYEDGGLWRWLNLKRPRVCTRAF